MIEAALNHHKGICNQSGEFRNHRFIQFSHIILVFNKKILKKKMLSKEYLNIKSMLSKLLITKDYPLILKQKNSLNFSYKQAIFLPNMEAKMLLKKRINSMNHLYH
jgi:hypothetical protein